MYYYRPERAIRIRSYGLSNFIGDAILCFATGGLWFIWICVRELKNR